MAKKNTVVRKKKIKRAYTKGVAHIHSTIQLLQLLMNKVMLLHGHQLVH